MTVKPWYQSKTLWLNAAMFVIGLLALPEVNKVLPPGAEKWEVMIVAVLNFINRFFTSASIGSPQAGG